MQNLFSPIKKRKQFSNVAGDRFGRLTLTGITYTKNMYNHWVRIVEAVCDCGEVKEYLFNKLASGETQSCGCFRIDVTRKRMTTHNLSGHPLYDVHVKMIKRCCDETDESYKNYGGRGIEVWKDWKENFVCFYDWCMANGYKEGLSLDRKDNNGNYSPQNCKFSTHAEQNRNRRNNIMITAFGETKCLWDWAKDKRCKVGIWGLRNRWDRGQWTDMEKMISSPNMERKVIQRTKNNNVFITAFGETKCMVAWLEDSRCVVKLDSIRERFRKGWDGEKILSTPPHSSGKKGILLSKTTEELENTTKNIWECFRESK